MHSNRLGGKQFMKEGNQKCPHCGKTLDPRFANEKYCYNCGKILRDEIDPALLKELSVRSAIRRNEEQIRKQNPKLKAHEVFAKAISLAEKQGHDLRFYDAIERELAESKRELKASIKELKAKELGNQAEISA